MTEKEGDYRNKEILKFIVVVFIFLLILTFVYYFFFYRRVCKDKQCFANSLVECNKAMWINDAEEATWLYTIKGASENNCEVEVKLLIIKKGKVEMEKAQGKSMTCSLPLNTFISPEQDLGRCSGLLKEELQDLLIRRLNSYILENLGQVSEELTKPI